MPEHVSLLPPELQLDEVADATMNSLLQSVTTIYEAQDECFSNLNFEIQHPTIIDFTDCLARALCGGEESIHAQHVVHRSFFFGLLVGEHLSPSAAKIFIEDYWSALEYMSTKEFEETAQEYLEEHPSIDGLIDAFGYELSPHGDYLHLAEIVAGQILRQIELIAEEEYFGLR